ncbi:hypothetical protein HYQ46_008929 [Verticillium longisporum]|nr:hypothetical protein HYQ46_008929 [Verticillium longisporum]
MLVDGLPTLQRLLKVHYSSASMHPVFDVADELVLQNISCLLRKCPDNPALLYAVRLNFACAVTSSNMNRKCLEYKDQTLSSLRQSMSSLDSAISESTLGAILLLAGAEARRGLPCQVQIHMGAIRNLLEACLKQGIVLSDNLKRAIFWQDLNSSVMTGSSRTFHHQSFPELSWSRDKRSSTSFKLPPGFQMWSSVLGHTFLEIMEDVHALQQIRDTNLFGPEDAMSMANVDNHQASIQSRIVDLEAASSISDCCYVGAYLCSTMLRCKRWRASVVPLHLSLQLLYKLQKADAEPGWDEHRELLTWLLHIGGAFAPAGTTRSGYLELLKRNLEGRLRGLYTSWPELLGILEKFIWSDKAFLAQVQGLWNEVYIQPELDSYIRT